MIHQLMLILGLCSLLSIITVANGSFIKVHLTKSRANNYFDVGDAKYLEKNASFTRSRSVPEATPACIDKTKVKRDSVHLPAYVMYNLHHDAVFFHSASVRKSIQPVLNRHVEGLGTYTVRDVFNFLASQNCYAYLYGGVVRDMFLNTTPNDVDARVDCTTSQIHTLCSSYYPKDACRINVLSSIVHIGVEYTGSKNILDLAPVTKAFLSLSYTLEFSANSLALDTNKDRYIVFDLTGYGVRDVCNKHIKIPTSLDWDMWLAENSLVKTSFIYRFWKLRTKGFTAVNEETSNYVIQKAKHAIVLDNGLGFKQFYCKEVYKAYAFDAESNACFYMNDTTASCSSSVTINRKQSYDIALKSDFGYHYWSNELRDMIPSCSIGK